MTFWKNHELFIANCSSPSIVFLPRHSRFPYSCVYIMFYVYVFLNISLRKDFQQESMHYDKQNNFILFLRNGVKYKWIFRFVGLFVCCKLHRSEWFIFCTSVLHTVLFSRWNWTWNWASKKIKRFPVWKTNEILIKIYFCNINNASAQLHISICTFRRSDN